MYCQELITEGSQEREKKEPSESDCVERLDNKNEAFSRRLLSRSSGDSLTQPAKRVHRTDIGTDISQLRPHPGISSSCPDTDTDTDIGKARPDSWSCGLLISARLISFIVPREILKTLRQTTKRSSARGSEAGGIPMFHKLRPEAPVYHSPNCNVTGSYDSVIHLYVGVCTNSEFHNCDFAMGHLRLFLCLCVVSCAVQQQKEKKDRDTTSNNEVADA
ncbi:hypothetical protein FCULG_00008834 [Fusarium culmorum]|uniref:Uncharacterized protein n=1 Tax=Fusarium culmorum TaxID=5516 RepID=A0A2T4H116_FUSCU|nr:hypothetical protein FCULG_00008834 [Fusarium culmorum]